MPQMLNDLTNKIRTKQKRIILRQLMPPVRPLCSYNFLNSWWQEYKIMTGSNTLIFSETKVKDGNRASLMWHFRLGSYYLQLNLYCVEFVLLSLVTMTPHKFIRLLRPVRNVLLLIHSLDNIFHNGSLYIFLAHSVFAALKGDMSHCTHLCYNPVIFGIMAFCSIFHWSQNNWKTKTVSFLSTNTIKTLTYLFKLSWTTLIRFMHCEIALAH